MQGSGGTEIFELFWRCILHKLLQEYAIFYLWIFFGFI